MIWYRTLNLNSGVIVDALCVWWLKFGFCVDLVSIHIVIYYVVRLRDDLERVMMARSQA